MSVDVLAGSQLAPNKAELLPATLYVTALAIPAINSGHSIKSRVNNRFLIIVIVLMLINKKVFVST